MRDINEYTAEVFSRSEKRIKERTKRRNKILALGIPICIAAITLFSVALLPNMLPGKTNDSANENHGIAAEDATGAQETATGADENENAPTYAPPENAFKDNESQLTGLYSLNSFSFSLTWNCYGVSSYNSETGELIKTTDASNPEDYITTYYLTAEQKKQIYDLIIDLNMASYPDKYNPHEDGLASSPPMTLILTVKTQETEKTIAAENIALTYESNNKDGQKFLGVCEAIQNILTSTDEWKALPDYEFLYE